MWSLENPESSPRSSASASATLHSDFLRRYARRMLNDVHGDRASSALPVLRRVLAAGVTPHAKLTALFAEREALQLKHMLHTLAAELGFARWEACKAAIDQTDGAMLDRYRFDLGAFGDYEKTWFPDEATAREWQREHGGYVVRYGSQAVAILND